MLVIFSVYKYITRQNECVVPDDDPWKIRSSEGKLQHEECFFGLGETLLVGLGVEGGLFSSWIFS